MKDGDVVSGYWNEFKMYCHEIKKLPDWMYIGFLLLCCLGLVIAGSLLCDYIISVVH